MEGCLRLWTSIGGRSSAQALRKGLWPIDAYALSGSKELFTY